ncbi:alpha/beta fold hydrolase [Maribacter sp. 2-571]|uniref:alpha/beta fold hydrolase n=1 Tax=Maribacter sp. 2-571 TaxID=3417569 RepID=UPI003D3357E6
MFEGFTTKKATVNGTTIHYRIGGKGKPLLLLHGYPQSHVIWHKIAPFLAERYTVVASDLRGYGDSGKPATVPDHSSYSKREMAKDQVLLMQALGFDSFFVAGHDRGGRVAHRMALDHPQAITKLAVLDIAPTYTMYKTTDMEFATAYFHWFFLIQPADIPEKMIGADPEYFLLKKFGQWGRDSGAFTEAAMAEYRRCLTPETIHASCEDYRASASIDLEHDQSDIDSGKKTPCETLCLWGEKGYVGKKYNVVKEWKKWADEVTGYALPCGHYLPEEAPDQTLDAFIQFFG